MKKTKTYLYIWRLFCVLLASVIIALLWKDTTLVFILLLILSILINIKSGKLHILFFITVAIVATLIESLTNSTGAWTYANQNILNFPIWLPLYWGMGGVAVKDVYLFITEQSKHFK